MTARNLFGALALDTTVAAARDLLTTIRDSVTGVLKARLDSQTITGTIAANNVSFGDSVDASAYRGVAVAVSGTFVGNFQFETSVDGVAWSQQQLNYSNSFGAGFANAGTGYVIAGALFGRYFRVRSIAWTSGTATVSITFTSNAPTASVNNPSLSASTNYIGKVRPDGIVITNASLSALNGVVDGVTDCISFSGVRVQVTGTWIGTLTLQSSVDGTNWISRALSSSTSSPTNVLSGNSIVFGDVGGRYFRVLMSAYTSGTAVVTLLYTAATSISGNVAIRSSASADAVNASTIDEVGLGAYNGSTVDRLVTAGSNPTNGQKALFVAAGSSVTTPINNATAPVMGNSTDITTARANHTLQVDVSTTAVGTAGNHMVRLEGSLEGSNWYSIGSVALQATSLTAADASNHAILFVSDSPVRYVRANWTTIPTGWTGTLTARVASA
jgi:hypothetical protein